MKAGGLASLSVAEVVAALGMKPLDQEGGWFRRVAVGGEVAGGGDGGEVAQRGYSSIYFLLAAGDFSALHRLGKDELWFWHAGAAIESLRLYPDGRGEWVTLGSDFGAGQRPQDVVAAGVWQGSRVAAGGAWALASCVVAPEFRWEDFELGERAALASAYREFGDGIAALTRAAPVVGKR